MASQDEVFGLPFLFTGGLPNSLEKFSEGNLRCFLIYLIEVVGKANRQNVWQKPAWWRSRSIPYSPITVETSRVPQDQVVKELRGLIESCYKYYNAEKILEVSRQLAEIPRILLGVRDNKDNTMTVYDTNSKAVYVTVRPENLYYDAKSLNKVSKDWRSSYTKEDVAFCEIKKASKQETQEADKCAVVIEVLDSDEDVKTDVKKDSGNKNKSPTALKSSPSLSRSHQNAMQKKRSPSVKSSVSRGVVIKSGNNVVIALSDSDSDDGKKWPAENSAVDKTKPSGDSRSPHRRGGTTLSKQGNKHNSEDDNDVEFVCEVNFSRPCPKRFKKPPPTRTVESCPNILILSDSDDDPTPEESPICISSYTSLAKNYPSMKYYMEAPKNVQTSILGPLICSPKKESQVQENVQVKGGRTVPPSNVTRSTSVKVSSDEEDIFKPTREELFLRKKKKKRAFYSYPASPGQTVNLKGPLADFLPTTQSEFMARLGMKENNCTDNGADNAGCGKMPVSERTSFVSSIRSMRTSFSRMPLEWIRALSCSNHIILSKKSSRSRIFDPTHINYEQSCSTDKHFVEYNIKSANMSIGKEGRSNNRQGRRGKDKNFWTVEKWWLQTEEGAQRSKRASLRMLKSLCSSDYASPPEATLELGSLAPTLHRLPDSIFERALHSTVSLKDNF